MLFSLNFFTFQTEVLGHFFSISAFAVNIPRSSQPLEAPDWTCFFFPMIHLQTWQSAGSNTLSEKSLWSYFFFVCVKTLEEAERCVGPSLLPLTQGTALSLQM